MTQWYVFQELSEVSVLRIQKDLRDIGVKHGMNGLILLAHEGCNGTVAGSEEAIKNIRQYLENTFGTLNFQNWKSDIQPFKRFKVDIRKEIVALKKTSPTPSFVKRGTDHLSPRDFHHMLGQEDVIVLDTRNTYESNIGKFKDAVVPPIEKFQEFPGYIAKSNIPKNKNVLMYCTSGIRCEKAAQEMRNQGYENVYQLDGGITNYIKEYPDGAWEGECFMFDHRVAVDKNLQPSKRYALCPSCGNPGDVQTVCTQCNTPCTLCEDCLKKAPVTCSKACKYSLGTYVGKSVC